MKAVLAAAMLVPALLAAQSDTTKLRRVANPRVANGSWIADPSNHLRADTRARIDSTIAALERETTAEIAVAVLDSLDGLEPADAALLLHRRWGVGMAARDNGIVLLWSPRLRKIYVAVGYGLEGVLPDARAGRIQDQAMLPAFRNGDFDGGMLAGIQALAAAAREETYSGLARASSLRGTSSTRIAGILGGVLGLLGLTGLLFWIASGRFPRRCPNGHGLMRRLGEAADNKHLPLEAALEEKLGSVDYDVFVCDQCDATQVVTRRKWFSGYENCPQCKRRTAKRTSRQLTAPTYSAGGTREVSVRCKNCSYSRTDKETIPMLVRSTSGSGGRAGGSSFGGGGSSFGGGSSGGGGAGRSY